MGEARLRRREERHVRRRRRARGGGDESPWVMGETATAGRATKNLRHGCRESRAVGVEREEMMSGSPAEGLDKRERAEEGWGGGRVSS